LDSKNNAKSTLKMAELNFYSLPDSEKKAIFQQISSNTGMPAFAVEKDWWVTKTLAIIFEMKAAEHLVFKGGTSLSKAWKLIERFSEDVDLAIEKLVKAKKLIVEIETATVPNIKRRFTREY
jgi:predicted nucleotidyltransferase component of viral defense system